MSEKTLCPICNQPVDAALAREFLPFCSRRCKVIDLGKWLSGDYRVAAQDESGRAETTDEELLH